MSNDEVVAAEDVDTIVQPSLTTVGNGVDTLVAGNILLPSRLPHLADA